LDLPMAEIGGERQRIEALVHQPENRCHAAMMRMHIGDPGRPANTREQFVRRRRASSARPGRW
jgi:hypothetical protein